MLSNEDIAVIKGLLKQGHKQHDIAAHFGCNGGRIAEIATGKVGKDIAPAPLANLPKLQGRQTPRFFTPSQTLEEQKDILNSLISTAGTNEPARVHLITPTLAQHVLENKGGATNRKPSTLKIQEYESAMSEDEWEVNGSTIVFSKRGHLMDGQHRLRACVRAWQSFHTYVVFGIDEAVFTLIDIGRKRSNADAFEIAGIQYPRVTAHATRWIMIFNDDPTRRNMQLTNEQALRFYNEHVDKMSLALCVGDAIKIEKESKGRKARIPASAMAALLYLFTAKAPKHATEFANMLLENKGQAKTAYGALRKAMIDSGGRVNDTFRNAIMINAWNAHRAGRTLTAASVRWDSATTYPEIS